MIAAILRRGHRSRELKRHQHLSPEFKKQTVELIVKEIAGGTFTDTVPTSDLVQ
jgi:hypothetical protein